MYISWNDIELMAAIASARSLSGAARVLGTTQPTVSRRLIELEAHLGEPLFRRTVSGTVPTSFGERLLEPVERMRDLANEVQQAAADADPKPRGVVRVSAAPGLAYAFVAPFAALLRKQLPSVRLEVAAETSYVDLVRREADIALRWHTPAQRDVQRELTVLTTVKHRVAACATRAYIGTLPKKYTLRDIGWIGWAPPFGALAPNPQLEEAIPGFAPAFASNDYVVQLRAAEAGAGAIVVPWVPYRLAPPTSLVELNLSLAIPPMATRVVAARTALSVPRVHAVAELLVKELLTTRHLAKGRR